MAFDESTDVCSFIVLNPVTGHINKEGDWEHNEKRDRWRQRRSRKQRQNNFVARQQWLAITEWAELLPLGNELVALKTGTKAHSQSVAIFKATLMCQEVNKMAIRENQSAISLWLIGVKLSVRCNLLLQDSNLTAYIGIRPEYSQMRWVPTAKRHIAYLCL